MRLNWRTVLGCAVAIVVIGGLLISIRCGSDRPRPEHAVLGPKLTLRDFQAVRESDVFRAELTDDSGGYSSGYRTRNVLFIEASGEARWLLPDDGHRVEEHPISTPPVSRFDPEPQAVAMVALATPIAGDVKVGDLYLYDLPGRRIQRIAEHVREMHGASLTTAGAAILYEQPQGYVLAQYDVKTLAKLREVPVAVPALR